MISDTHGLLRPAVFELFAGVDGILHAGDVGDAAILDDLEAVAPVLAVWGNVDGLEVRDRTRESVQEELGGVSVAMIHGDTVEPDYDSLVRRFPAAGLIVHGHSHVPRLARVGDALLVNPGSAGPRRFRNPATAALVRLAHGAIDARHVDLESGEERRIPIVDR